MDLKLHKLPILLLLLIAGSCSTIKDTNIRLQPRYVGVDAKVMPYVDEFMLLSAQNNIVFRNYVTIGLTNIDRNNVIGTCTYAAGGFREIDIDLDYFTYAGELSRRALVFHELIHCYCTRSHDYDQNQPYDSDFLSLLKNTVNQKVPWTLGPGAPGFFADACPTTIMHPVIPPQTCLETHFDHYNKEMFERCVSW